MGYRLIDISDQKTVGTALVVLALWRGVHSFFSQSAPELRLQLQNLNTLALVLLPQMLCVL